MSTEDIKEHTETINKIIQNNNDKDGYKLLKNKIKTNGMKTLYNGSLATFSSTVMGHFPWFFTIICWRSSDLILLFLLIDEIF